MRKNSHHKPESIEKIRQHSIGSGNSMFGRKLGPESREQISRSIKRTWKGAAFRKRWREARWGKQVQEGEHVDPRTDA